MATEYQVTINMDDNTVNKLNSNGYKLFGFKAVQTPQSGLPVVWFKTTYSKKTVISWEEDYEAYTSTSDLQPGVTIEQSASYPIDLGQTLHVTSSAGTGHVTAGQEGMISIYDEVKNTDFTCGLSQKHGSDVSPLCAFELAGTMMDEFIPIEKVMLTFASSPVVTSTVIEQSLASSVLLDLTMAASRTISYVWGEGWEWGGESWGKEIPADQSIVGDLILKSDTRAALPV